MKSKTIIVAIISMLFVCILVAVGIGVFVYKSNSDSNKRPTAETILVLENEENEVGRIKLENLKLVYTGKTIDEISNRLASYENQTLEYPTGGSKLTLTGVMYWDGIQYTTIKDSDFLLGVRFKLESDLREAGIDKYRLSIE